MAGAVSEAVIRRLPGYYRHLSELEQEGVSQISSKELGMRMHLTASQIRQDMNCFGGFGRQGFGYSVSELRERIGAILGIDKEQAMIIVGAGNIGRALALSDSFMSSGFRTEAVFDSDTHKIGTEIGALTVRDAATLTAYIAENKVDICVLAVPVEYAQEIMKTAYTAGIRAFWNFAPMDLKLPEDAVVVNVHLEEGLQILSFRMLHTEN